MSKLSDITAEQFAQLLLDDVPLIDTRSPGEFSKGSFPKATSLPLMNDPERAQVGLCYKQQGQDAAIDLGHRLVGGALKDERVQAWCDFIKQHPKGALFCWRGGLRSRLVQTWIKEAGLDYPRVQGGYKALRRYLIEQSEALINERSFTLLAGRTGSGKTQVLQGIASSIDLEGIANHRGSSFGHRASAQPSQIDFENSLAIALLKLSCIWKGAILLEDESGFIGSRGLPLALYNKMKLSPRVLLEVPLEQRIDTIWGDYIVGLYREYIEQDQTSAFERFANNLQTGLLRLKKRLGNERYFDLQSLLEKALDAHLNKNNALQHKDWIARLLVDYYDPSYDYQLQKMTTPILCKGDTAVVQIFLNEFS